VAADRIELLALEDGLELHATWLRRPLHEIQVGIEEPPAALAGRLRRIHRGVGPTHEFVQLLAVLTCTATPTLTPSRTVWTMTR
jgi:hypothetical protein